MLKVIKDNEHSLLLNHYGRGNRDYLIVSLLTFFSFERPEEPLKEKEMWPFVQEEMGEEAILDQGLPKVHGEVLLSARCHPPDGQPAPGCPVSFTIGPLEKHLYVFGHRRWEGLVGGFRATQPEPFTSMDLSWRNAFGGPGYDRNPLGKGYHPKPSEWGEAVQWLPNVEYPSSLVGLPTDRPEPAGFLPLDLTWPQRFSKRGTYGDKWLREQYPYYPEDMDLSFFNAGPEDQWLREDYFRGDETFTLDHLHPTKAHLSSRLPGLRQRCFILRRPGRDGDTVFEEFKTRLDTVWLFPHAERGITIHRATVPVQDDEHSDVSRIFLVSEPLGETGKNLEEYHQEMLRRLNRKVEIDPAPLEAAKKKIKKALERVAGLGEEIKDQFRQTLGQAPAAPKKSPAQMAAAAEDRIAAALGRLDKAATKLAPVKARFGHLVKIDLSSIQKAKDKLLAAQGEIKAAAARIEAAQAQGAAAREKLVQSLEASPQAATAAEQGVDVAALIHLRPRHPWHESGLAFLDEAGQDLAADWEAQGYLKSQGLEARTIRKARLGVNLAHRTAPAAAWGLERGSRGPELELPAGLVIPRFEGARLKKLLVIRPPYDRPPEVVLVDGSEDLALAIGLDPGKAVIRARNEIEAWLIHQEIGGLAGVVALPRPGYPLPPEAAQTLAEAPQFLVLENPELQPDWETTRTDWQKLCPRAEFLAWPDGLPPAEAKQKGFDLRRYILEALKPGLIPEEALVKEPRPGDQVPPIVIPDIKALIQEIQGMITGAMAPALAEAQTKEAEMKNYFRQHLEKQGRNLDEILAQGRAEPRGQPFDSAQVKDAFQQARDTFQKSDSLTPEVEKTLGEYEARATALLDQSAARYAQGQAKIEAVKNLQPIPDWAREKFAALGFDPNDAAPLTREEVIRRHAQGLSLAGKNLAGVDLSGLDLAGVDLGKANLEGTNFGKTRLDGARLDQALAQGADFSGASLRSVRAKRAILAKAKFGQADLSGADLTQALFNEADLTGAVLVKAVLDQALLEKAKLDGAKLNKASIKKGYFLQTTAQAADFRQADLTRSIFMTSMIRKADFTEGRLHRVTFYQTQGGENSFSGADIHDLRAIGETALPDSDFRGAQAGKGFWREADLSHARFGESRLDNVIFENCNLTSADLSQVRAHGTRFNKSDLSGANLEKLDLFRGSLRKARLVSADLSRSNLYGVEFFKTVMGQTRLNGANLKMTRIDKFKDALP
ncbi:MAG: DUF2169 domain-containing protein [Thermodesulfobacteriota bacterium]